MADKLKELLRLLEERLVEHDESRNAAQKNLHKACEGLRAQIKGIEGKVENDLEEKFIAEDNRLQTILSGLLLDEDEGVSKKIQKAKTELLVEQTYDVIMRNSDDENEDEQKSRNSSLYELKTERKASFDIMGERKSTNLIPSFTKNGELSLSFTFFNEDEM